MGACQRREFWRDFDSVWRVLESDLSLVADRHLHRLKPEEKRLESFADWSERSSIESDDRSCCSSRRCEVELELSHSFTPATIKAALLTAFLKRANREDLKKFSSWGLFYPEFLPNRKSCASRECIIPTCDSSVKTTPTRRFRLEGHQCWRGIPLLKEVK